MSKLSIEFIKMCLDYNPDSGKLTWKTRTPEMFTEGQVSADWKCKKFNSTFAGKEAMTAESNGYRLGNFFGKILKAHRVAWAIYYNYWPENVIDHKNGNRSDNRIENLRSATRKENSRNTKSSKNATSKFLGVYWDKERNKWIATIKVDGKSKFLGRFDSELDAAKRYNSAASIEFGEFAALNNT